MKEDIRETAKNTIKLLEQITSNNNSLKHLEKLKKISLLSDEECNYPKEIIYYNDILKALKFISKVKTDKMKNNAIN
ncbi:hypothetical protein JE945_002400 [Flavobacterium psychrophilum]|nr:hypothetical protein [Flavobacterium psychrophilum]